MPIQLSAALNAGDLATETIDHVRVGNQSHRADKRMIVLSLEYGTVVEANWVSVDIQPAESSSFPSSVIIAGSDYTTLTTTHASNDGELTYAAVKRGLYEYLQSKYASLAGTII